MLASDALADVCTVAVGGAAAIVLWWKRPNPVWLIGAGALAGALIPGLG